MRTAYIGIARGGLGNKLFSVANGELLRDRGFDTRYFYRGTAHGWTYEFLGKTVFRGISISQEPRMGEEYFADVWERPSPAGDIKIRDRRLIMSRFLNSVPGARERARDFFMPSGLIDSAILDMYGTEEWEDTVSVHVRRGDYLSHPVVEDLLGKTSYYSDAVGLAGRNRRYIVVSDDIEYCRKEFPKTGVENAIFHKTPLEGEEGMLLDLFLPSFCRYNITSNSTFSWWQAYLNCDDGYRAFAPCRWSKDPSDKWNPGYPVEWKVINYKAH